MDLRANNICSRTSYGCILSWINNRFNCSMKNITFSFSNISNISTCDDDAVYHVCHEVAALCDRTGNDRGRCRREHKLEEPVRVIGFQKAAVSKVGVANETVSLPEGERISHQPIRNTAENWKTSRGTQYFLTL